MWFFVISLKVFIMSFSNLIKVFCFALLNLIKVLFFKYKKMS